MSIEDEVRYEARLEDAISEYERAKAMYDEWWSEEKLNYLEDALGFITGEELPIKKVGDYWDKEKDFDEVIFLMDKVVRAYKERKEYWRGVVEDKASHIACIVPFGNVIELNDGRMIEGIAEAV